MDDTTRMVLFAIATPFLLVLGASVVACVYIGARGIAKWIGNKIADLLGGSPKW